MITKEDILLAEAVVAEMEARDERVFPPPTQPEAVSLPRADVVGDKIAASAITHRSAPLSPNGAEFSFVHGPQKERAKLPNEPIFGGAKCEGRGEKESIDLQGFERTKNREMEG